MVHLVVDEGDFGVKSSEDIAIGLQHPTVFGKPWLDPIWAVVRLGVVDISYHVGAWDPKPAVDSTYGALSSLEPLRTLCLLHLSILGTDACSCIDVSKGLSCLCGSRDFSWISSFQVGRYAPQLCTAHVSFNVFFCFHIVGCPLVTVACSSSVVLFQKIIASRNPITVC